MTKLELAGELIASNFDGWSQELRQEFRDNEFNLKIGSKIIFENEHIRVWSIDVLPGERLPAHRHTIDYFWTALTDGTSVQHMDDGSTRQVVYRKGDTRHFVFSDGAYILHDLVNAGSEPLEFITAELLP